MTRLSLAVALVVAATVIACSDDDKSPTGSTQAAAIDSDQLAELINAEFDFEDMPDSFTPADITFRDRGAITSAAEKTGSVRFDEMHVYSFILSSTQDEVTVHLDGHEDIVLIIVNATDSDRYLLVAAEDNDNDSPHDGFEDRSTYSDDLSSGTYLAIVVQYDLGSSDEAAEDYRLELNL